MKIAFAIFRYFPHGGLQRDMMSIAAELIARGHEVTVYCGSWEGAVEVPGLHRIMFAAKGWSNHAKARDFIRQLHAEWAAYPPDVTVAFNRMPGADIYFAADNCFAAVARHRVGVLRRFLPRYRTFCGLERAVFGADSKTLIMYLTPAQLPDFLAEYGTPADRLILLPPGIARDRRRPDNSAEVRAAKRLELKLDDEELLLLEVGSGFRTKGVDRSVRAVAALPDSLRRRTRLMVAGQGNAAPLRKLAAALGIRDRVDFAGGRGDVPQLLLAADLLVHPARNEATGTVLIEALAAGLPVLTTANCGFCGFVAESGGAVCPQPFIQADFNRELAAMLASERLDELKRRAVAYGGQADFYGRAGAAADLIEKAANS